MQVRWEMTYNRTLGSSERIYLIETTDWYTPGRWQAWISRPLAERLIASTSAIEAGGCTWSGFGSTVVLRENASKMGYDRFQYLRGKHLAVVARCLRLQSLWRATSTT